MCQLIPNLPNVPHWRVVLAAVLSCSCCRSLWLLLGILTTLCRVLAAVYGAAWHLAARLRGGMMYKAACGTARRLPACLQGGKMCQAACGAACTPGCCLWGRIMRWRCSPGAWQQSGRPVQARALSAAPAPPHPSWAGRWREQQRWFTLCRAVHASVWLDCGSSAVPGNGHQQQG